MQKAVQHAFEECKDWPGGLPDIALGYALRQDRLWGADPGIGANASAKDIPVVVGLSTPNEVHEAVRIWREVNHGKEDQRRKEMEQAVVGVFKESGMYGRSWASYPPEKA